MPGDADELQLATTLARAADHVRAQDWAAGERLCRAVLVAHPDHAEAMHLWGLVAYGAGELDQAVERLRRATALCPDDGAAWGNLGNALRRRGELDDAIAAFRRARTLAPDTAELWYNSASVERAAGRPAAAVVAYRRAIELAPSWSAAWNNLALALCDDGLLDEAVHALGRARELEPRSVAVHNNLGNALRQQHRLSAARAAFRRALELDPLCAEAAFNLHALLYAEADPEPAAEALEQALAAEPGHVLARFFLGTIRDQQGQSSSAEHHFSRVRTLPEPPTHLLDSWSYIKARRGKATRLFALSGDTLAFALAEAPSAGLVLEFGVRRGVSIRFIATRAAETVHGFDSFRGLPESWGANPEGSYSTGGELPRVPRNVALHVGWFRDSLPTFLAAHREPIRFANVDCDLYSSTKTVLDHLGERLVPGSVLVFDEYLGNPGWRDGEFKAFQQAVADRGWRYEYLAFSLFSRQAAVRITATR